MLSLVKKAFSIFYQFYSSHLRFSSPSFSLLPSFLPSFLPPYSEIPRPIPSLTNSHSLAFSNFLKKLRCGKSIGGCMDPRVKAKTLSSLNCKKYLDSRSQDIITDLKGLGLSAIPRLRECCRQVQAEVVSKAGTNFTEPGNANLSEPCTLRQISCLGTPLNSWSAGDNSSLAMAWWTDRNDETHLHWTGDGLGYGKGDFEGGGGGCACGKDASCHGANQGG